MNNVINKGLHIIRNGLLISGLAGIVAVTSCRGGQADEYKVTDVIPRLGSDTAQYNVKFSGKQKGFIEVHFNPYSEGGHLYAQMGKDGRQDFAIWTSGDCSLANIERVLQEMGGPTKPVAWDPELKRNMTERFGPVIKAAGIQPNCIYKPN